MKFVPADATPEGGWGLRALGETQPLYEAPQDDLAGEVLIPAFQCAAEARIVSAYFTSDALAKLSPGLASYINRSTASLRLLLSPHLTDDDLVAVQRGSREPEAVVCEAIERTLATPGGDLIPSALAQHASDCLGYMVARGQAELRFVLMRAGMFHPKQWLLRHGDDWLAVHGSGNVTHSGLFVNGEQMSVDRNWCDGPQAAKRISKMVRTFEEYWSNQRDRTLTISAPQAAELITSLGSTSKPPTTRDFWAAWRADRHAGLEPELPPGSPLPPPQLAVPAGLQWREGRYGHQGTAVDEFLSAAARGVMAIATGGGKTRTALIAATQLQDRRSVGRPMLVMILVPTLTLERQWSEDVREFGIEPVRPSQLSGSRRAERISEIQTAFATGGERTEVVVCTQQLFRTDRSLRELAEDVAQTGADTMLVGDEVHNLGAPSFLSNPPEAFAWRLGLSATPIRQFDSLGTDELFAFFGPQVFEFGLRAAIDAGCLVPYDYHVHTVSLTEDELERYASLTDDLFAAGFRMTDEGQAVIPNSRVEHLLRQRRAVLEQASGKVPALSAVLRQIGPASVRRTLIYASSKPPELSDRRQIEEVNEVLQDLGIVAHELTAEENAAGRGDEILHRFAAGEYKALTAMRVLDEGVDVPATESAFILASTTVEREWVQRRGRVLRQAEGKEAAAIHDFVVVPPDLSESAAGSILRSELRRVRAFASLARNEWDADGPRTIAEELDQMEREASRA
ncbi:DEAD/DEAH box helicase family protein [Candidatus Poriferisodalis sp.]|uniref:DEAD/DEAH box helicase family protein n=1 Tax=Candidatus Poriferisodalis sp. TaxID=3101277 RepID=UPI003B01C60C